MSFGGRLETLELSTVMQTLAVGSSSGRLTVTRVDRQAVLVLRGGRVVYVAGGSGDETLAGRLLRQGLIGKADLMAALERQHDGKRFRRLGEVLVDMGLLAEGTIETVVRQRMDELMGELLSWETGFFRFEPTHPGSPSGVEVDMGDFVLPEGVAPVDLLMRAMTVSDHDKLAPGAPTPSPDAAPPSATAASRRLPTLSDTGSYTADYSGEVVLLLLRFASQILSRAVVFAVEGNAVRGVGEFGLQIPGRAAAEVVGETVLSLEEPSILRSAVESRAPYVGPLEPTHLNLRLVRRLGGTLPREAVALPLLVGDEVHLVLYGDNAPENRPIGPLDVLEAAAARTARILERTIAARRREGTESGS